MGNIFQLQKEHTMKELSLARSMGEVDAGMLPLIDYANSLPDYYTTSTCAGRISLFHDPGSKPGSAWVGKWHRMVEEKEVLAAMEKIPSTGTVWFMHEPTIVHIACRDIERAVALVNLARNCGYKKVGILSCKPDRVLVEICGTERIDAPVAEKGKVITSEKYIKYLVGVSNRKYKKGALRLKRLEGNLRKELR
jgi:tRNA wybutosine-synthesizing protein 3